MNFYEKVYEIVRQIPPGRVASYGQIAALAGNVRASRAVGYALHRNPLPGIIPCHRVVNREGRLAPGFAFGGPGIQQSLLEAEGVAVQNGFVDLRQYGWKLLKEDSVMTFEEIKKKEQENIMPTYGRFQVALENGKGASAYDGSGKKYIDFGSGIGVNSLGYCDSGWVKAVSDQAARLQHISNLYYSPVQVELAEKLCAVSGYSKVFFGNSGAESNECAIKLARKYSADKYSEKRNKIVTLQNSFHGRTVTTLAATGQDVFHQYFLPLTEGFAYAQADDIESVKAAVDENTCAIMMEFIQGEGGVVPISKEFAAQVRALCDEKDLLLIADEVQTGVGRTGAFYCWQNYGVKPDVITSAKGLGGGLPIGACLCSEKLGSVMGSGMHGSTFGGNPVVCAGALEVVRRVSEPEFLSKVQEKGRYIREKLLQLPNVAEVRGMGMMLGVGLKNGTAKDAAAKCVENGLLILTAKTALRLLPPLTITYEEIDEGLAILKKVLEELS